MEMLLMNHIIRLKRSRSGFTIIELMIAMAIFSVGILSVVSLQITSARNNSTGNIRTQANMLAMTQLEILKNQEIGTLLPGTYNDSSSLNEHGLPGGIYSRSWSIIDLGTGARAISVTVQWQRGGRTNRVEVLTNTRGNGV
jgi:prepilin-type N-terminal cleavage/methylation domain-containing protein